ncbi:uncharacterized protein LOC109539802 isoform X1 [Dendroctonus ponderosae]|uniref:uncharacterized protein LOC109539802 isoform X1 n=1 Tax=Dendroctonus ponderosae TaxID=77166 RepID=UPI0020356F1F|nr:uncharacterized protein LOC109539802 isoform X1 [Dendroctonus ponderosae]XP_048523985.1 uncharacterized protein LOC109539802 isoform X1 [Dendroctonus ponderosae]
MACSHFLFSFLFIAFIATSTALNCYQCNGSDSSKPFQCNEWLTADIDIKPEPCDAVYGAKYCIKTTGRFQGSSLNCYQCSSAESLDCSDVMIHMGGIQPKSCDHVFEAEFCIKSTSLNGIGTSRYCSSNHMGNYCNYVKQPGDTLWYRSCIYTCTGDGCNHAHASTSSINIVFVCVVGVLLRTILS